MKQREYAVLSVHQDSSGLRAVVTDSDGEVLGEKTMVASRYPQPGWLLRKAVRFATDAGWRTAEASTDWYLHEGVWSRNLEREAHKAL